MTAPRLRVYLAGPISTGDREANVARGIAEGLRLLDAGYAPFIPHLSHVADATSAPGDPRYEAWLAHDVAWLETCGALIRLSGDSSGADREVAAAQALGIPIYPSVDAFLADPPEAGDPRFHALLREIGRLHDRKQADYGRAEDPFANVRASADFGVAPWVGAMIRANDKMRRIQRFAQRGRLHNERVEDSLMDLAVYALIALILYRE